MIRYLVPSRGRPANIRRLWQAWQDTVVLEDTELYVIVDGDDPTLLEYQVDHDSKTYTLIVIESLGCIGPILNEFAPRLAQHGPTDSIPADAIGFMGDDHVPRTRGWDAALQATLPPLGVAYGNDLLMGAALPTAVMLDAEIVRKLGWMVPPGLRHLYFDNFWHTLGTALNALVYRNDIIIEHMHYIAGKALPDEGYKRVNSVENYLDDANTYEAFRNDHGIERAVEVIRG